MLATTWEQGQVDLGYVIDFAGASEQVDLGYAIDYLDSTLYVHKLLLRSRLHTLGLAPA